jgi:hypothetical protein
MSVIPALDWLREKEQEFSASKGYREGSYVKNSKIIK